MKQLLILLATFSLFSCSTCEDGAVMEAISPNEKYVATVVVRNCGATTDYVTVVSMRNNPKSLVSFFNSQDVLVIKGDAPVEPVWDGDGSLKIKCDLCKKENIFKHGSTWSGVKINLQVK